MADTMFIKADRVIGKTEDNTIEIRMISDSAVMYYNMNEAEIISMMSILASELNIITERKA